MLTEREKKLMRIAHETGYLTGLLDAEEGKSNLKLSERFDDWLEEPAAEGGYIETVGMIISHEAGK